MRRGLIIKTLLLLPIISLIVSLSIPFGLFAQSAQDIVDEMLSGDNAYNTNPYAAPEGADSLAPPRGKDTAKKVRIKRPLESYFFNDSIRSLANFKWNLISGVNEVKIMPLDTTLTDWHIDYPFLKEGVGDMYLGGLGQPTQPINYYDRSDYYDFKFAQPYDAYTFRVDNAPFYNSKKPFTQMQYLESGSSNYRESNFGILHAQNINPSTGFAIDYKARSTKGLYQQQETRNHNLALTAYHTGRRYSAQGGFINNDIRAEENGGVVGLWTITDSIFEMPSGVPMKLTDANAYNRYRNYTLFAQQSYGIPLHSFTEDDFTMANHSAVYIGHSIEYERWSKVYSDDNVDYTNDQASYDYEAGEYVSSTESYYDNWFIDPYSTRDSIHERRLANKLYVQIQPYDRNGFVGLIDAGIGLDLNAYNYFTLNSYITGELEKTTLATWYAYGGVSGKLSRYLEWGANAKVFPSGYRAGDLTLDGRLKLRAFIRSRAVELSGAVKVERESPSFWQENLFSNHYVFLDKLETENKSSAEVVFTIPSFNVELKGTGMVIDNLIYYDENSNITQNSGSVTVLSLYLSKMFRWKGLHLDNRLLVQYSSDQESVPLPDFSALFSYYYEFWLVKDVLNMQIGIDCRYTSSYYMPDYNPALSTFFNQRSESIGSYPYMDAFVAAKWKRMRILVKYQHLNNNLFGNNEYFTVANYPMNPGMFKFGISWGFYD
ncbi:MAG: putative porin [Rikenellaceae bacterium]